MRATIASAIKTYGETLEDARERYPDLRTEADPTTFDEYKARQTTAQIRMKALRSLPSLITSPIVGQFMHDMPTRVFTLPSDVRDFLLSDDPIARTNGLKKDDGHFAMPISPRKLFVSCWKEQKMNEIAALKPNDLVTTMNRSTVEGARYFVASRERSQERFIRNRFSQAPRKPLLG